MREKELLLQSGNARAHARSATHAAFRRWGWTSAENLQSLYRIATSNRYLWPPAAKALIRAGWASRATNPKRGSRHPIERVPEQAADILPSRADRAVLSMGKSAKR